MDIPLKPIDKIMKAHEFTIFPIEIGSKAFEKAQKQITSSSSFEPYHELGKFDFELYRIKGFQIPVQYDNCSPLVGLVGSSLCIVLYGITAGIGSPETITSQMKGRRNSIHNMEKLQSEHTPLEEIYTALGGRKDWVQRISSYAFTFYVFELDEGEDQVQERLRQGYDNDLYRIVHALVHSRSENSSVPINDAIGRATIGVPDDLPQQLPYLSSYWNIAGLATWSSFVLVAGKETIKEAIKLALEVEVVLQSEWNRCNYYTRAIKGHLDLGGLTYQKPEEYLKVVLGARQISEGLTAGASGRKRPLFEYLVETSRFKAEIEALSQATEVLKNEVERRRSRQHLYRQGWVTVMLAAFAGVGVAQPLADSWGRFWLSLAFGLVSGTFAAGFSLWKTR